MAPSEFVRHSGLVSSIAIVQRVLDGPWRHASAARQACRDGAWAAFVRGAAPARPTLFGRGDHARCIVLAESAPTGPILGSLELVPLWGCLTYETPADDWVAVHGAPEDRQARQRLMEVRNGVSRSFSLLALSFALSLSLEPSLAHC